MKVSCHSIWLEQSSADVHSGTDFDRAPTSMGIVEKSLQVLELLLNILTTLPLWAGRLRVLSYLSRRFILIGTLSTRKTRI